MDVILSLSWRFQVCSPDCLLRYDIRFAVVIQRPFSGLPCSYDNTQNVGLPETETVETPFF